MKLPVMLVAGVVEIESIPNWGEFGQLAPCESGDRARVLVKSEGGLQYCLAPSRGAISIAPRLSAISSGIEGSVRGTSDWNA